MTPGGAGGEGRSPRSTLLRGAVVGAAIEPRHRWRAASRARRHGSAGSAPSPPAPPSGWSPNPSLRTAGEDARRVGRAARRPRAPTCGRAGATGCPRRGRRPVPRFGRRRRARRGTSARCRSLRRIRTPRRRVEVGTARSAVTSHRQPFSAVIRRGDPAPQHDSVVGRGAIAGGGRPRRRSRPAEAPEAESSGLPAELSGGRPSRSTGGRWRTGDGLGPSSRSRAGDGAGGRPGADRARRRRAASAPRAGPSACPTARHRPPRRRHRRTRSPASSATGAGSARPVCPIPASSAPRGRDTS